METHAVKKAGDDHPRQDEGEPRYLTLGPCHGVGKYHGSDAEGKRHGLYGEMRQKAYRESAPECRACGDAQNKRIDERVPKKPLEGYAGTRENETHEPCEDHPRKPNVDDDAPLCPVGQAMEKGEAPEEGGKHVVGRHIIGP